ncbi:MAG: trigger factor [Acidobacteria bacterium]|nr:MAG: trigger factor [Acidobacteriota bacterium]
MKVQVEDVSPVKKRMEVEVPPAEVEREMEKLVRGYAKSVRVPGFRKGHVPPGLVRQRFAKELEQEVKERLMGEYHAQAVAEKGLDPLHDPVVEEVEFRSGEPLRFRTLFEVRPEVPLGRYRGLEITRPRVEPTDEEVEQALESLRESAARFLPVEPRTIVEGDYVVVDVVGRFIEEDGKTFRKEEMMMAAGAPENLPEFNEALSGASPGSEKLFHVSYPADYQDGHLAGRRVEYTLRERHARRAALESAMRQLIDAHDFDLPDVMVEEQLRRQMEDIVRGMMARGMDPEKAGVDWKEIREQELPLARRRVRGTLLLDEIARREGLDVTDSEVSDRIEREASELGLRPQQIRQRLEKGGALQALRSQILREKTLDFVLNQATITS